MDSKKVINDIIEKDDCITFYKEWVNIEDYELKILILTSILAENSLAYRGTLTNMCEWLGVKNSAYSNNNIKKAIDNLKNKELIFYKKDGYTYTITISEKGMKEKEILRIRKAWVNTFKTFNKDENNKRIDKGISIDWIKVLKVFVYLFSRNNNNLIRMSDIADGLNISSTTVQTAIKVIEQCDLSGIKLVRETIKEKYNKDGETYYYNKGSNIGFIIMFEE